MSAPRFALYPYGQNRFKPLNMNVFLKNFTISMATAMVFTLLSSPGTTMSHLDTGTVLADSALCLRPFVYPTA